MPKLKVGVIDLVAKGPTDTLRLNPRKLTILKGGAKQSFAPQPELPVHRQHKEQPFRRFNRIGIRIDLILRIDKAFGIQRCRRGV